MNQQLGLLLLSFTALASVHSSQTLRAVVDANLPVLQACYQLYLETDPTLLGKLKLTIDIAQNGSVTSANVATETTAQIDLANCISQAAQKWRFEPGEAVTLEIPFYFKPITADASVAKASTARSAHPGPYFIFSVAALMLVSLAVLLWLIRR